MSALPNVIMTDGKGAKQKSVDFSELFHGTSYHIHTVKRSSSVCRKDGQSFQGDVRQADQARLTKGRLDTSNIINLYS